MAKIKHVLFDGINLEPIEVIERDMTSEEELKEWQTRMAATDAKIPRYVEDLIDGVQSALQASGVTLSAHIPDALLTAYVEKKSIRNQKPKG